MKRTTLTILALLATGMGLAVLIDSPRKSTNRIVPDFERNQVVQVILHQEGEEDAKLVRDPLGQTVDDAEGPQLVLVEPFPGAIDAKVANELLLAIERLTFRRVVSLPSDPARRTIAVTQANGVSFTIGLGKREPSQGWVWVSLSTAPDVSYLADSFAVEPLEKTHEDLRRKNPFEARADPTTIVISGEERTVTLRGKPWCIELSGSCVRARDARVEALIQRLRDLRVGKHHAPEQLENVEVGVRVGDEDLQIGKACPGQPNDRKSWSKAGLACVDAAFARELADEANEPSSWVALALVAVSPDAVASIEINDGSSALVLERETGRWRSNLGTTLSATPVREWLTRLAALRASSVSDQMPAGGARRIVLSGPHGEELAALTFMRDRRGEFLVRRSSESVSLAVAPEVEGFFASSELPFADREVLAFEPVSLSAVEFQVGKRSFIAKRGETADEWIVAGTSQLLVEKIIRLRDEASHLHAERVVTDEALPRQRRSLTFVVDPPPTLSDQGPSRYLLEVGDSRDGQECRARREGRAGSFILRAEVCAALRAPFMPR